MTTRDRILEVALEHFTRDGFEAATTRAIAADLGITSAALYYHFPSKGDCLVELVEPYVLALEELIASHRGSTAEQTLGAYLDVLLANVELARLIDDDLAPSRHPDLGPRLVAISSGLLSLVRTGRSRRATLRASAAIGALRRPVLRLEASNADRRQLLSSALAALHATPVEEPTR